MLDSRRSGEHQPHFSPFRQGLARLRQHLAQAVLGHHRTQLFSHLRQGGRIHEKE